MKKLLVLSFTLLMALILVSCGDKQIKIGVVLPDAAEERWARQDGEFLKAELDKLGKGYEYDILFSGADESKELQNVEALIARGAKVIIITTHGSGAAAVDAAAAAGVKIIAHDRMSKSDENVADFYTTFNSWNVGKAQGQHLVEMAIANGASATNKVDLAIFAGRTADWPNATYFFGGAMEAIQPKLDHFNIITPNAAAVNGLALYTEATFNEAARTALQAAMSTVDTDWNPEEAANKASAVVASLTGNKSNQDVYVLAPNDDTSAAIRIEFAKMENEYRNYYTTGQDASNVALASLMGDPVKGNGTQTMTVFKDTSKLSADSVKIAKNIVDGVAGLTGLQSGPSIDGAETAYTAIDVLLASDKQKTYNLIFKTGYKNKNDAIFDNIDFSEWE
ncbi:MAG: substrate-binding domain-containing protein [Acholeplasmataceae bacterium]|nr:substrate-binding domain-containing protein [Acholeplasmataceae bacterium]